MPVSPRKHEGEAGDGGTEDRSGGRTAEEIAPERPGPIAGEAGGGTGDRSGGRTAEEIALERPGPIAGETGGGTGDRSGGRTAGEIAPERPEPVDGEPWEAGPVWTMQRVNPETVTAQRAEGAERTARAEEALRRPRDGDPVWSGPERAAWGVASGPALVGMERSGASGPALVGIERSGASGPALERAGLSGASGPAPVGIERPGAPGPALERMGRSGTAQSGLEGLYRQSVRGLRPAAPALPPEQAGRTARMQEPESAASLAVDELDRAVRRDSRRYDGGMSIY